MTHIPDLSVPEVLDPLKLSSAITKAYHNCRIAAVNDHEVRLSVMTNGFQWHHHPHSDESFYVIDGELLIEFADHEVKLMVGEFLTVPKGILHRTRPGGARSVNLTFEKADAETIFV